jgi:hypothetical protein
VKITKIISVIILCAILISSLVACGNNSDIPDGYQLAVCEGDSFRLYVPTQWTVNVAGGVSGAYYSMAQNSAVSVYMVDDAGEMTIEEYWEYCNSRLAESLDGYSFSGKTEKAVLGGQPAIKSLYSGILTVIDGGESKTETYKFLQVIAKYKGDTYVLIYSASEQNYDSNIETVEGNADGAGIIPYFRFAEPYVSGEEREYSDKVISPAGMKLISTEERAYRFFGPENWNVNKRAEFSAAYFSDDDSSNVSLQMYMTNEESKTVEEYFAECEVRYKDVFDSYALESALDITMDGISAKKFVYTVVSGGAEYKQMQAIVMKGAVYYVLTYTATPELFDSHIADVEKMIECFDIR